MPSSTVITAVIESAAVLIWPEAASIPVPIAPAAIVGGSNYNRGSSVVIGVGIGIRNRWCGHHNSGGWREGGNCRADWCDRSGWTVVGIARHDTTRDEKEKECREELAAKTDFMEHSVSRESSARR
jgi:hypothetical protein